MASRKHLTGSSGRLADVAAQRTRFESVGIADPTVRDRQVLKDLTKPANRRRSPLPGVSSSFDDSYKRLERAGLITRGVVGHYVLRDLGYWVLTGRTQR